MPRRRRKWKPRGIPTSYNGIKFRSQLESRWAIYLDALGIQWAYEPMVLGEGVPGGGWIPDFGLLHTNPPTLLECKPALSAPQLAPAQAKAEASGWVGRVVLLGADPRLVLVAELDGTNTRHQWLPGHVSTEGITVGHAPAPNPLLRHAWAEAVNRTQWRAKQTRRAAKPRPCP